MSNQKTLGILPKKGRVNHQNTRTVHIGLKDQVFFTVPKGYLLTLNWLGGTTFSARLYNLLKT